MIRNFTIDRARISGSLSLPGLELTTAFRDASRQECAQDRDAVIVHLPRLRWRRGRYRRGQVPGAPWQPALGR